MIFATPLASALDVQVSGQEALEGVAAVSYAARNPAATLKHPASELGGRMNRRANLRTFSIRYARQPAHSASRYEISLMRGEYDEGVVEEGQTHLRHNK